MTNHAQKHIIRPILWLELDTSVYYQFIYRFVFHFVYLSVHNADTLIYRLSMQRVLDVSADWTEDQGDSTYSSIKFDFRVTCDDHYYGQGCENLCRPRDDQFGHYTCSSTGGIVCLSGWQGDYCTKRKCFYDSFYFILILFAVNKRVCV